MGETILVDETRTVEYKEIRSPNPIRTIINAVDNYAVSFLNSEGGSIYWGINDERTVVGLQLDANQRDELRRSVNSKLVTIQPPIDPTAYRIEFYSVIQNGQRLPDVFVIEVRVPSSNSDRLYFTSGGETFVRLDGIKKKLSGPEIQDWIIRRMSHINQSEI